MLADLRARIAPLERGTPAPATDTVLAFGHPGIEAHLPWGGLSCGALHEVAGSGPDTEHAAAAAQFVAGLLAPLRGLVLWALAYRDLFAPGLAAVGLHPDRVVYAEAGGAAAVLLVMEEALRQRGLAGVVGEVDGRLTLTASRRLQLAAESSGVVAVVLRRSRRYDDPLLAEPSAALTRWRVGALPSGPPLPAAPDVPGLGRARWRLDLVRCRGGEAGSWIVEACWGGQPFMTPVVDAGRGAAGGGCEEVRQRKERSPCSSSASPSTRRSPSSPSTPSVTTSARSSGGI